MSTRYAVLLRGVNVGGVKVLSADLADVLRDAGTTDVRTVLASGNALVSSSASAADVKVAVETALEARYGRRVGVIVRTQEQVAALVADCPYEPDSETHHAYVVLTDSPDDAVDALASASRAIESAGTGEQEAVAPAEGGIYWWCPRGQTLSAAVATTTEKAARTVLTTTRNVRTLRRLTTR